MLCTGWRDDTSCMKAYFVKWGVFLLLFFLLAVFLRGRGGHGCLENRVLAFPFSASLIFVFRSGLARDVLSS